MESVIEWLQNNRTSSGSGSGYYGYGSGSGEGSGEDSGYGEGSGEDSGYGEGSGEDSGYGEGSGEDSGYYGYGSGEDYGYGSGSGSGYYGYGIKRINGMKVYRIDGLLTVITRVKLALAKGFILNRDLTLTPCYIAKGDGYFAHGKTVKEAEKALQEKIFKNMDTEEAIGRFLCTFKKDEKYKGQDFFLWHHYLTGSCEMGRRAFVRDRGLDLEAYYTVEEFLELCKNSYGGDILKQLQERVE